MKMALTPINGLHRLRGSVVLDPDVRAYFPDEESVNNALRTLIALVHPKSA